MAKLLNIGIDIGETKLCTLFYADDIVLLSDNPTDLQTLLNTLNDWCTKWKLRVNYNKSNVIHFRKKRVKQSNVKFQLGEKCLEYASHYKYLGIHINEFMDYSFTAEQLSESASRALGSIIYRYKSYPEMGFSTFTKLYENCVIPVMDYASAIWGFKEVSKTG